MSLEKTIVSKKEREERNELPLKLRMGYWKIFVGFFVAIVSVFLVLPSVLAIPMSFSDTTYLVFPPKGFSVHWYHTFFTNPNWIHSTLFSVRLALITTLVSLIVGIMASFAIVRGTLPGKEIIHLFIISPMMIPIIITAFAVYGLYAKLRLIGTTTGLVIAHTILCVPYVILVITANLYRFDQSLEMAARNLGANALKTFLHINLPLIKPGIIAAGVFSFVSSLDDLVLAMFLIGTSKMTLPLQMFTEIQMRVNPVVAAASTIFVVVAIGNILVLSFIRRD
jgi:ABC-type spermidine/putrescine transport system permease subunit II